MPFLLDCGLVNDCSRNNSPSHGSCIAIDPRRQPVPPPLTTPSVTSSLILNMSAMLAGIGLRKDIRTTPSPVEMQQPRGSQMPPTFEQHVPQCQILQSSMTNPSYRATTSRHPPVARSQRYHQQDYASNYLTSMSTTSGLGSNYTTNTTSNLSGASSLSSHVSGSEENIPYLSPSQRRPAAPFHRLQAVQALKACETDIFFNNYAVEQQRSAYGGCNTPELMRSPYNSRVPQMGLAATGHRRTMSSNFSGYSTSYGSGTLPPPEPPLLLSKNPFLSMINGVSDHKPIMADRTYENLPFSPNRHVYSDFLDRDAGGGTLRSSMKKKYSNEDRTTNKDNSFSSSGSRVRFSSRSDSPSMDDKLSPSLS